MKQNILIAIILFLLFSSNTFSSSSIPLIDKEEKDNLVSEIKIDNLTGDSINNEMKIFDLIDELNLDDSRKVEKQINYYNKYLNIYKLENLKKEYNFGKVDKEKLENSKKELETILLNIEKISPQIFKLLKKDNSILDNYTLKNKVLNELGFSKENDELYFKEEILENSFYKRKLTIDNEYENFLFPKEIKYIYIQSKIEKSEEDNNEEIYDDEYNDYEEKYIFTKKDFLKNKLNKISIESINNNGYEIDFLENNKKIDYDVTHTVNFFIEKNGLYIKIGSDNIYLNNTSNGKRYFLEEKYRNDFGNSENYYERNKNSHLENKIETKLENLSKNKGKKDFLIFLETVNKKLKKYSSTFKKEQLIIAEKITPKSNFEDIYNEFKKSKFKEEVFQILSKQVNFRIKNPHYDKALKEFLEN